MEPNGKPTQSQETSAQSQVWKIIYGFSEPLILRCAVELRIPDIIHDNGGQTTLSDLASKLPLPKVNTDHLYRVLRFLVHMKIFNQEGDRECVSYSLTPAGRLLTSRSETNMVPILLGMTQKDFLVPWHYMKDGLSGETTAFEKGMGMTIWEYLERNPEKSQLFNEGMAGETRLLTRSLIAGCRDMFEGIGSLVDVGGGNGTTLKAISQAFPQIKCTVFDLPYVIEDSVECPGVERVAGDMFRAVPRAQAIMLKLILHDWSDEDCIKILKKCKEAVPQDGGKVIIVDVVLDVNSEHELSTPRMVLDIDMLVNTGGKERTEEDWNHLILSAGYKGYKIRHIAAVQSVIEAFPY
ncbi:hypothetical protein MRB53_005898 [Persea americana]|uniref:Uncharacterized protein n=1 Tax=Persea americana TaxID=3435 RepID=A0ACC2MFC7_PERAE|nr:hypothetical protein MRB53_005898 [Persea americana]